MPSGRAAGRQALGLVEHEGDFTTKVIETAQLHGWMAVHFRPARTQRGYRTAYEGNTGFPDLVLARDGVVLVVELKAEGGRFQPGQREWLAALGPYATVWRPRDWDEIRTVLSSPRGVQPDLAAMSGGQ